MQYKRTNQATTNLTNVAKIGEKIKEEFDLLSGRETKSCDEMNLVMILNFLSGTEMKSCDFNGDQLGMCWC